MATKKTEALPALVPLKDYAVMTMDPADLREIVEANLGGRISRENVETIKAPGVGGAAWKIETAEGTRDTDTVTGVIIHRTSQRAYYEKSYKAGSSEPPTCFSTDMETGIGSPGGSCETCPFNQFGSARVGEGKACREYGLLFLLMPDQIMPTIVRVPPTSLKRLRQYMSRLVTAKPPAAFFQVITEVKLVQPGDATPEYHFRMAGRVESEHMQRIRAMREQVSAARASFVGDDHSIDPETGEVSEAA